MKNKIIIAAGSFAVLCSFAVFAHANPSYFALTAQTSTATSTPVYQTPGNATSTVIYDTNANANAYAPNKLELLMQFSASSTNSVLNTTIEYATGYDGKDCLNAANNCDWYADNFTNINNFSTTTSPLSLNVVPTYQWSFATSTVGGAGFPPAASSTRATRAIQIKAPTRYIRAVSTCAIGGTNCAIWAQFVPIKEIHE